MAFVLTPFGASAQIGGSGGPAGMTAVIAKLFGDNKAFSAKAEVQRFDNTQAEIGIMPMDFSLLGTSIRVEMDYTQGKNRDMPPGTAESLKQMGMAHVISIINPGKKTAYVLYPDQKVLLSIPLPKEETAAPELQKTPQGNETVDGHPCVKNKLILTDDGGEKVDVIMWNATDLKDFPVQIQTKENENTSMMRFKQVQLTKPEAVLFDPPAGYTHYTNRQDLKQAILKKAAPGSERK